MNKIGLALSDLTSRAHWAFHIPREDNRAESGEILLHGNPHRIRFLTSLCLFFALSFFCNYVSHSPAHSEDRSNHKRVSPPKTSKNGKYRWLFSPHKEADDNIHEQPVKLFQEFDARLKRARDLYLSAPIEDSMNEYRKTIDELEQVIDRLPVSHQALGEALQRLEVFEEFAVKRLGPVDYRIGAALSKELFQLMEEKRKCLRLLTLKQGGVNNLFDLPSGLLREEQELMRSLIQQDPKVGDSDRILRRLQSVREALASGSRRWSFFMGASTAKLGLIQEKTLKEGELILDMNIFRDRILVGYICRSECSYFQSPINYKEIQNATLDLIYKLKRARGDQGESFMGHEWKEACRQVYQLLFSALPRLRSQWSKIYILPDKSLWYLPFSALLDTQDTPLSSGRTISLVPSSDMLRFIRSKAMVDTRSGRGARIMAFESMPWIPERQLERMESSANAKGPTQKRGVGMASLILSNRSYPKPSDFLKRVDRIAPKSALWAGPAATLNNWLAQERDGWTFSILAVPAPITDSVDPDSQPRLIFSWDGNHQRELMVKDFFARRKQIDLLAIPNAWIEDERDAHSLMTGQGPLLLSLAAIYSGVKALLINYSNFGWGERAPYLMKLTRLINKGLPTGEALNKIETRIPGAMAPTFGGKPPDWTGWALVGEPGS